MAIKVYDKVKWHYPDGKYCPNLSSAISHIKVLLDFLYEKNLLSEYGIEIYDLGVDIETSITSEMLNDFGINLLDKFYKKWLKNIVYYEKPSVSIFERNLKS